MQTLVQRDSGALGQPLLAVFPELTEQAFIHRCQHVYQTGEPDQSWGVAIPVYRNNALETGHFNVLLTPYYEGDKLTGVLEICTEVTEQVQSSKALASSEARYRKLSTELDEQVRHRTAELQATVHDLQRSNDNLQQFAYVASHDLQEPLRKIQSFGDLLMGQYAVDLGAGADYLLRMQVAANRMSTLIRDLLSFSRISTRQETASAVSLVDMMQTVQADLELTINETDAIVRVETLPTVIGNPSQLRQLFQNLVSNALKFHRTSPSGIAVPPVVTIRSCAIQAVDLPAPVRPTRMVPAYYRVDVADNGIGFDEKYLDRIFQVFQRLHGKNAFAGTGIGLAICEKVVANHGGAITASSTPGLGATFSVYLPVPI